MKRLPRASLDRSIWARRVVKFSERDFIVAHVPYINQCFDIIIRRTAHSGCFCLATLTVQFTFNMITNSPSRSPLEGLHLFLIYVIANTIEFTYDLIWTYSILSSIGNSSWLD